MELTQTISKRLTEAMNLRGFTIAELSRRTKIDTGTITHYKKGDYLPKQDKIYIMAVALDVSPSWLMGLDVPMQANPAPVQSPDDLLAFALYGETGAVTAEDLEDIRKFAEYVKARRK